MYCADVNASLLNDILFTSFSTMLNRHATINIKIHTFFHILDNIFFLLLVFLSVFVSLFYIVYYTGLFGRCQVVFLKKLFAQTTQKDPNL